MNFAPQLVLAFHLGRFVQVLEIVDRILRQPHLVRVSGPDDSGRRIAKLAADAGVVVGANVGEALLIRHHFASLLVVVDQTVASWSIRVRNALAFLAPLAIAARCFLGCRLLGEASRSFREYSNPDASF